MTDVVEVDQDAWGRLVRSLPVSQPLYTKRPRKLLEVTSMAELPEQSRADRQLFSTVTPLFLLHEHELAWLFEEQTHADFQELLARIDEARARYRLALATLVAARPIAVRLIERMFA